MPGARSCELTFINLFVWYPSRPSNRSEEFFAALNQFDKDTTVRVIVVTGEGRAFCAGADAQGRFDETPKETAEEKAARKAREEDRKTWRINRFHDIGKMNQPVIACINGGCVGIGLSLALACDMRFAANEAKIGVIFPQRGLIAEDGMGFYLPHLVGTGNALMLLLTGDVMQAQELPSGFIQRLFEKEDLVEGTLDFARRLAINSSPTAVSVIKAQTYNLPYMGLEEAQAINDKIQAASLAQANPDHQEGFMAFGEKRAPNFAPLDTELPFWKLARELLPASKL